SVSPLCPPGSGTLPLFQTQFGNLGISRYEGVLLDVHHDVPHGIYWTLSGGLTRGYLVSVPPGFYDQAPNVCDFAMDTNCQNIAVVPNINFNGSFTNSAIPYSQGLGTIGYRWNPGKSISLSGIYYGNNNSYNRPAFMVLNADFGYPLTKDVSLIA